MKTGCTAGVTVGEGKTCQGEPEDIKSTDVYTDKEMFLHLMKKLEVEDIKFDEHGKCTMHGNDSPRIYGYNASFVSFKFDEGGNIIEMDMGEY